VTKSRFKWRCAYDGTEEAEGLAAGTTCEDESLTQQSFRDDADLNVLVRRFGIDKIPVPPMAQDPAYFGDFSNVPDLRTALDLVNDATNRFMELPPQLRAKFDNSPAKLWHFVNDPDNASEAVRLGLLATVQPETPPPVVPGEQGT